MTLEQLADGVYAVEAPFEDVPMQVYVILAERLTVIDPGVPAVPESHLARGLAELGRRLDHVDLIVNTHGHHDHRGGNGVIARHNPGVQVAAHPADAGWISDAERYIREDLLRHSPLYAPPPAAVQRVRALCGEDRPVDLPLHDGQEIDLGGGHILTVRHAPAHTTGSIALFHQQGRVLFTGDALQARGTRLHRRSDFFPNYRTVHDYRASLDWFERCGAEIVGTAHEGVCTPHRAAQLVGQSREFTDEFSGALTGVLRGGPLDLPEVVRRVRAHYPKYGPEPQLWTTTCAHLAELVTQDLAVREGAGSAATWRAR